MFRGEFEHTIDGKGRTSLPAAFRELLSARGSDRLVVTAYVEPCLIAYPLDGWAELERKLEALPSMNQQVRMVKRALIGRAHEIQVDRNGRILIPPPLRAHAGLERDVVFAGHGDTIEIWAGETWRKTLESIDVAALQSAGNDLGI